MVTPEAPKIVSVAPLCASKLIVSPIAIDENPDVIVRVDDTVHSTVLYTSALLMFLDAVKGLIVALYGPALIDPPITRSAVLACRAYGTLSNWLVPITL